MRNGANQSLGATELEVKMAVSVQPPGEVLAQLLEVIGMSPTEFGTPALRPSE